MNNYHKPSLLLSSRLQHLAAALLIFTLLYKLTNAYSAALFDCCPERVHHLATSLDNSIAFIPAMIVPYSWSLILFVVSFFMVRTAKQLLRLTARLITATVLACTVFYLYPAQFSFIRPLTMDWTNLAYLLLSLIDKPYNQLPSLYVSYALLLGVCLWDISQGRATRQIIIYRLLLTLLCSLIIVSTVFTYQHHLLDILGGFILAGVVLFIVNKISNRLVLKYLTVAITGALLLAITGFFLHVKLQQSLIEYVAIALAFYWLASFMRLAWAYQVNDLSLNKSYFQKNSVGQLTLATWLSFAPILFAYKVMSLLGQLYLINKNPINKHTGLESVISWNNIDDNIYSAATARLLTTTLAREYQANQLFYIDPHEQLINKPIELHYQLIVVDMAAELTSHFKTISTLAEQPLAIKKGVLITPNQSHYLYLSLLDLQPFCLADMPTLVALFKQIDKRINEYKQTNINAISMIITLINFHCVMGFSRSVAMQVLYLVYCDKLTIDNYQTFINKYHSNTHLSDSYLPKALIIAISGAKF